MTQDLIRYDVLCQEALRGVVKKIIAEVVRTGLPGQHHFFISFDTQHPGVRMSTRLRQRYPDEMTVVLQHQFWDLNVTDTYFEVGLSFSGIPERLLVPFLSIKGFFDPSVQFGLQFEVVREGEEAEAPADPAPAAPEAGPRLAAVGPRPVTAKRLVETVEPAAEVGSDKAESGTAEASKTVDGTSSDGDRKAKPALKAVSNEETPAPAAGATVVSLDTFRKKP